MLPGNFSTGRECGVKRGYAPNPVKRDYGFVFLYIRLVQEDLGWFNQAGSAIHSLLFRSLMVIPLVSISAGLSTPDKWFNSSMVEISRISSSLFDTKTICLFWAEWSQCRTVTESVQWCIDVKLKLCSFSICALTRDVDLTIARLVLVSRYLLWCNVSKTGETCDKTAPSVIEQRNFLWGLKRSNWTKKIFMNLDALRPQKRFLCSITEGAVLSHVSPVFDTLHQSKYRETSTNLAIVKSTSRVRAQILKEHN